jgi:hypothetical protein
MAIAFRRTLSGRLLIERGYRRPVQGIASPFLTLLIRTPPPA